MRSAAFTEMLRAPPMAIANLSLLGAFKIGDGWCAISGTPLFGRVELLSLIAPSDGGGVIERLALVDVDDSNLH